MEGNAQRLMLLSDFVAYGRSTIQTVACAALVSFFGCTMGARPALAEDQPPADVRAASTRSFPATVAKQRMQASPGEGQKVESKVIGGKDAAKDQFKWQVAIIRSDAAADDPFSGFFCGATLIGWHWALTAAHCTFEDNPKGRLFPPVEIAAEDVNVYVGSYNFTDGERIAVKRIVRHEHYNHETQDNDLALFELEVEPSDKSHVGLLDLIAAGDEAPLQFGRRATVLGWGSTAQGLLPLQLRQSVKILQYVDGIQFKPSDRCNQHHLNDLRARTSGLLRRRGESEAQIIADLDAWYPPSKQLITDNMVCAGTEDGSKDACFGDSGGPLVVSRNRSLVQAGIVSWGPGNGCGLTTLYGVYVHLSRYLDWIASYVR